MAKEGPGLDGLKVWGLRPTIGALIIRMGFGAQYSIIIIRNPPK